MNFKDYQEAAARTAVYHGKHTMLGLMYASLGLNGEAGEVAELVKKAYRDGKRVDRDSMTKELGDVLWYVSAVAGELGISLEDVAEGNLAKLQSRRDRGVLSGSGSDR